MPAQACTIKAIKQGKGVLHNGCFLPALAVLSFFRSFTSIELPISDLIHCKLGNHEPSEFLQRMSKPDFYFKMHKPEA